MSSTVEMFRNLSLGYSKDVTQRYSTSFSIAIKLLAPSIRQDIYNIYGFVRLADEIVDTFHSYPKEELLKRFENDVYHALQARISLNPALDSFQYTALKYNIGVDLISAFLSSMKRDLTKAEYSVDEYKDYIYGSADVVGLMCLKVFVNGDERVYNDLKSGAMRLGSAFQKVNFLRDVKDDYELLNRSYFPGIDPKKLSAVDKENIVKEIREDLDVAYLSIQKLPPSSRFGVYMSYRYYLKLLKKLEQSAPDELMKRRVRIPNLRKMMLVCTTYLRYKILMKYEMVH